MLSNMELIVIIQNGPGHAFVVDKSTVGTVEILDHIPLIMLKNFGVLFGHSQIVDMDIITGISTDGYFGLISFDCFDF
jgi:hypothetical protein